MENFEEDFDALYEQEMEMQRELEELQGRNILALKYYKYVYELYFYPKEKEAAEAEAFLTTQSQNVVENSKENSSQGLEKGKRKLFDEEEMTTLGPSTSSSTSIPLNEINNSSSKLFDILSRSPGNYIDNSLNTCS